MMLSLILYLKTISVLLPWNFKLPIVDILLKAVIIFSFCILSYRNLVRLPEWNKPSAIIFTNIFIRHFLNKMHPSSIEELLRVDLQDASVRLNLHLALYLHQFILTTWFTHARYRYYILQLYGQMRNTLLLQYWQSSSLPMFFYLHKLLRLLLSFWYKPWNPRVS